MAKIIDIFTRTVIADLPCETSPRDCIAYRLKASDPLHGKLYTIAPSDHVASDNIHRAKALARPMQDEKETA